MKILDNVNVLFGDDLKETIKTDSRLKIAASCFSIFAYEALKTDLEKIASFEFIFTSPTFVPDEVTDKVTKERREFFIPKLERERNLYGSEFEIALKNKLTQRAIAKECAEWIRCSKAEFRSNYGTALMQQFACVQTDNNDAVYLPLHGFTAVDLGYQQGNAVSNLVNKLDDVSSTSTYLTLFDKIWDDQEKLEDVTERLCDHITSIYQENSPERIYFLMLYNIFREFLDDINEDVLPNDLTGYQDTLVWQKLFDFQKDAATGIINKLETYNGCILADSVGLGKTFSALAVIKYYELRNKSVLVLCPKKLADNWLNYNRNLKTNIFAKDRFSYDVFCHTDLQRTSGESFGTPLNRINWGNYDLVVIDESHNFRNNFDNVYKDRETRYQTLMNTVIKAGVKTKVLMLSATPVNNRFSDLRNQLALTYEGESENLSNKLNTEKSIEEIFRKAQTVFNEWSKLPSEERTTETILNGLDFDFFELLDSVTIARSRKHIETFYDTSDIGKFPKRLNPVSIHCQLTHRKDVIGFNEIFNHLSKLKLSVYAPVSYILSSRRAKYEDIYDTDVKGGKAKLKQADRERNLQALMTTNLLKRLESSVEAFRLTLKKLKENHEKTLDKIAAFNKTGKDTGCENITATFDDVEFDEDDLTDIDDNRTEGKVNIHLGDMDLKSWEHDLQDDLKEIDLLLAEMEKVTPEDDEKLQHLKTQINKKITSPINPGNKKILLFTAFVDTANYLYKHLAKDILENHGLHTGIITGAEGKSTLQQRYDFQSLLTLFSPIAKEKAAILPEEPDHIDLLIGTDCISEGQNLQDCDYLINYDIHWNPVRIIQRFGRIDRIGSKNETIQLVNYWPDITLDEYINLKERVENRMVITDVTATGDDNVLSAKANDISYRKEQLHRLQEEVIEMEDLKTGVSITDLGLNDFRMDLLNYVKENDELINMPNGLHAVVPSNQDQGLYPGIIFTLRNRNQGINLDQLNRLHPYYLIYIGNNGEVITAHTEVKKLLDSVRNACKGRSEPVNHVCKLFNTITDDGRNMESCSNLLDQAIRSIVDLKEDNDIDSLFTGSKTTALVNSIAGLDDFELVAFLVIQE